MIHLNTFFNNYLVFSYLKYIRQPSAYIYNERFRSEIIFQSHATVVFKHCMETFGSPKLPFTICLKINWYNLKLCLLNGICSFLCKLFSEKLLVDHRLNMADESTPPTSAIDQSNGSFPSGTFNDQPLAVAQHVVLSIIFLIISITGIIGNSIVILAIVLSRKLRSTFNWFILNLACADLLTSICLPFYVASLLISEFEWTFKFWLVVISVCIGVSLTTHAFISFTSWYFITRNQEKSKKNLHSSKFMPHDCIHVGV